MIKISFCTSYKNRLEALKRTLPSNLAQIPDDCEIVISNLDGTDELMQWSLHFLSDHLLFGKLKIFNVSNVATWSSPVAKNISHRISEGQYLFNLDADNFVTKEDVGLIRQAFDKNVACMQWSGSWDDGSFGRIGIPRRIFNQIGGYDDTLLPMGAQDLDLIKRLNKLGVEILDLKGPRVRAITNGFDEKVKSIGKLSGSNSKLLWEQMNDLNVKVIDFKMETFGPIRKNLDYVITGTINSRPVLLIGDKVFYDKTLEDLS